MKFRFNLTTVLFILLISIISCKTDPGVNPTTFDPDCVVYDHRDSVIMHRVKADCAIPLIAAYDAHIDAIEKACDYPNINTVLNYGSSCTLGELKEIIRTAERDNFDEVYIMGATKNDTSDVIFVLMKEGTSMNASSTAFYNFTRPCPPSCPD